MAFSPSGTTNGTALTGVTLPTFTLVVDTPKSLNANQWYVSSIGGTWTGTAPNKHSALKMFILTFTKPTVLKTLLGKFYSAVSNIYSKPIPVNIWEMLVASKASVDTLNPNANLGGVRVRISLEAAPGVVDVNPNEVMKVLSLASGAFTSNLQGIYDSILSGTK